MNNIIVKKTLKDKKNYISIIIIFLSIILITIAFSFYKMCSQYYSKTELSLNYRTLYLDNGINKYDDRIEKIDHVVDYFKQNEFYEGVAIDKISNYDKSGSLIIKGIGDNTNINLVSGKRNIEKNELICPTIFSTYSLSELANDSSLIIKYDVGDIVKTHISQYDDNLNLINTKHIELKIVGQYMDYNLDNGFNVCYGTHELVKELYSLRTQYEEVGIGGIIPYIVTVDDYDNISKVITNLNEYGYEVNPMITFDNVTVSFLYMISAIVVMVITIITIVIILTIYNKNKQYYILEGMLYKTYGYTDDDIINIYTKGLFLLEIIGSIIALIILIIAQISINIIINNNPFAFYGMPISISIFGIIFGIVINILIIVLLRNNYSRHLKASSIIVELKYNE